MTSDLPPDNDWRWRVFDSLSFPTLVLRPDRVIVSANRKFIENAGLTADQIIGRTCQRIIMHNVLDDHHLCSLDACPLDQTVQSGTGHSVLRRLKADDGSIRWEDRVFSPIKDDAGCVIYIIESFRDVTKTKRMESALDGIRQLLDRVIQSSASAIVAADNRGRVLIMNPAAEKLFETRFGDSRRLNTRTLYPDGVARDIMKRLRSEDHGGPGKLTLTRVSIKTARGEEVPVEMTGAIIYEHNEEYATMGIYNDLRERMAIDQKLKEAEQLVIQSEKMASLGRLAAGVAHEINNPLTGIVLYGNMAAEALGADHPVSEHLDYILEDAGRCKDIVQQLLAYSRRSQTSREYVQMNQLVNESLGLIRDQKLFMNITDRRILSPKQLPMLVDRNRMRQVVIILVMNAIDAMDRRGILTLRTYSSGEGRTACLEVTDTGVGIPPKDVSRIFEPFYTTKAPGKGTGLGLSTAYGIVKEHGGAISVSSTGPEGTTFLVTLPMALDFCAGMPESIG